MDIDTHLRKAYTFVKEEPVYAILGGLAALVMNLATLGVLSGPIVGGYLLGVLRFIRDNRKPSLNDLFEGFQRLGYLFSYSLIPLLTLIGFLLLILPGMVLFTWWMYVLLLMIDTGLPLSGAMAASRRMVQDKGFFRHFVFVITLALLPSFIINAVSLLFPPLRLMQLLVFPFQSACLVSLYLEYFSDPPSSPPPLHNIPA